MDKAVADPKNMYTQASYCNHTYFLSWTSMLKKTRSGELRSFLEKSSEGIFS